MSLVNFLFRVVTNLNHENELIGLYFFFEYKIFICNLRLLAATTLRNNLGLHTLQEVLQEKEKIAQNMQEHLDSATHAW